MSGKDIPMVAGRKQSLPTVYGDTPSFLGSDRLVPRAVPQGYDVVVAGVPWEGAVTWGSYTGCELAPRAIRHAAARYGGFLPEYEIDLFDHLRIGDAGDVPVDPNSPEKTMGAVFRAAREILGTGCALVALGGDHSFSPEIVRALAETGDGRIGVVHFDAHLDNAKGFGEDKYPRCGPLHRIAGIAAVRKESIVHIGIRGPRNSPAQLAYARAMGASVFTIREIRSRGIDAVMDEAVLLASAGTDHIYVTICSDCVDAAFNPGGPADFNGLFPGELFSALYRLGEAGIAGLDYVEVYPLQDPHSVSSHLAAWALIHALAGLAARKRRGLAARRGRRVMAGGS
jgi:guanidinopropionase